MAIECIRMEENNRSEDRLQLSRWKLKIKRYARKGEQGCLLGGNAPLILNSHLVIVFAK